MEASTVTDLEEKETQTHFIQAMFDGKGCEELEQKMNDISLIWDELARVKQSLERSEARDRELDDLKSTVSSLKRSFARVYGKRV